MGDSSATESVKGAISDAKGRWARLQQRRPSVRHLLTAWQHMNERRGNLYAAAITYFSFLALFPLLLLGVAVLGFVLHAYPHTLQTLLDNITKKVPGQFGNTLKTSIKDAIAARAGVGIVGLVGVLLTGLGWIANLRSAIEAVWGLPPAKQNFLKARLANLVVLVGLGLGAVISIAFSVVGTSLTDQILRWLGLSHVTGATLLLKVLGIALAVAGDVLIFLWLLVRLPGVDIPRRVELKGALFAAVGFEVLKIIGTYTIAHTANSPTAGPFAGILAVLIWIQLVARYLLFSCAWTAVLAAEHDAATTPAAEPEPEDVDRPDEAPAGPSPAVVGATLIGAGAVAGAAAATWALTRPHSARSPTRE